MMKKSMSIIYYPSSVSDAVGPPSSQFCVVTPSLSMCIPMAKSKLQSHASNRRTPTSVVAPVYQNNLIPN